MHCSSGLVYSSLLLHKTATVPCKTEISSLERLYEFCSLACSLLGVSSEYIFFFPVLVTLGCL
jgi:hypothetical protein